VVRVPGYRSRGPGAIPGATRFSEKWVWNGVHSASWVQLRSCLKEKVAAPVLEAENTAVGIRHADHVAPLYPQKLPLTSPTGGGCSVGIVHSRTQVTEFLAIKVKFIYFFSTILLTLLSKSLSLLLVLLMLPLHSCKHTRMSDSYTFCISNPNWGLVFGS
jgi:hypothetical protein